MLHNVPTGEPNHKTRSMSKLQEVSQCMPCDFHKLTLLQLQDTLNYGMYKEKYFQVCTSCLESEGKRTHMQYETL